MFIDAITFIEVWSVKNIGRILSAMGATIKFVTNIATAPFSMYHF